MGVFQRFEDLDNEVKFTSIVEHYYQHGWPAVVKAAGSSLTVDKARLTLAYNTYQLSLENYTVALRSQNPDHYKRSGALLHALYKADPVTKVNWSDEANRLANFDNVGVSYGDAEHWENYISWHENYCNHSMAFDLAFRCCQIYEGKARPYTDDFLDNMCYYMAENPNINVGSFVMILKAFMS